MAAISKKYMADKLAFQKDLVKIPKIKPKDKIRKILDLVISQL